MFGQSWIVGSVFGKVAKGATYGLLRGLGVEKKTVEQYSKAADMAVSQVSGTVVGVMTFDPVGLGAVSVQNYGIARDIEDGANSE